MIHLYPHSRVACHPALDRQKMLAVLVGVLTSQPIHQASCGSSLILSPDICRSVKIHKEISRGIVKVAFEATVDGHDVVVKQPLRNGVDSGTWKAFLPAAKLFKEAMYLHHMACKYSDHIPFYGVCIANDILESFLVMGRGYPMSSGASWDIELGRLEHMNTVLADLKREQFVMTANGSVSLIDWGDVLVKGPGWGFFDRFSIEM